MSNEPDKLLAILSEPRSFVAESYRGLRTSIQRALNNGVKKIMFVSCYSGDGKSMVCANVAAALSQLFLQVTLVDADLRRPTLTNLFNATDKQGLGDLLAGRADLDQVLVNTGVERLSLVPAGFGTDSPGDLLGLPSLATFCGQLAARSDVVIFDTSPLSACSDALSLGPHMDASAMVINPRRWEGEVEVKMRESLESHGIPVMGVILTGTDPNEGYGYGYAGKYGYGAYGAKKKKTYGYGYGYGDPDDASGPPQDSPKPKRGFFQKLASLWED
jgi:capsular exopolysaccharide synthesis family protein